MGKIVIELVEIGPKNKRNRAKSMSQLPRREIAISDINRKSYDSGIHTTSLYTEPPDCGIHKSRKMEKIEQCPITSLSEHRTFVDVNDKIDNSTTEYPQISTYGKMLKIKQCKLLSLSSSSAVPTASKAIFSSCVLLSGQLGKDKKNQRTQV
ncbi:hypothetical protein Ddc_23162 [Ditylenchus destructor]|nr:hypothetical protein Ddc_23162 [Ditylenchus destructor]